MKTYNLAGMIRLFLAFTALFFSQLPFSWAAAKTAPKPVLEQEVVAASSRQAILSFKDMGAYNPIQLRGVDGNAYLSMGVRLDETVTKAKLHLDYTLSPALLPGISHIKVYLNDEVLTILPITKESLSSPQKVDINLDPRFFTDFNKIRLQLIGHYTSDCEFPLHTSLWADISNTSRLEMSLQPTALRNDLALLPAPFFDKRDNRPITLPFVFATAPSLDTLRAAGGLASWFGSMASYRSTQFPVYLNHLPERYGVVFATNDDRPKFLANYPNAIAPTITLITHPDNPSGKLLLVLGRNAADLKIAADALALGKAAMTGSTITVKSLDYPPRRLAYDAPNWLQIDKPISFGQLTSLPTDLQRKGVGLEPIRINARLPADLFTWEANGVPIDIRYRYTPPMEQGDANLKIEINDHFVESIPLLPSDAARGSNRVVLPVLDDGSMHEKSDVITPAFQLGSNNQLSFSFYIPPNDTGHCKSSQQLDMQAAIDPDSTLNLSHFDHYAAMPNLTFFANSGFPFTKYADLAETTVVLPDEPNTFDMEAMFNLLGNMSRSTGYPALRFKLIQAKSIQQAKDSDLLIIASGAKSDALGNWGKSLPVLLREGSSTLTSLGKVIDTAYDWVGDGDEKFVKLGGGAVLQGSGPLSAIVGFESPLSPSRSVVAITANTPEALNLAITALNDTGKVPYIRGDLSLMRGDLVESYRVNGSYFVGELPWWRWLWFHLHRHALLLTVLGIVIGLFAAALAFRVLSGMAARRLGHHKG
jgi:cellulose synthase operon protein B